MSCRSLLACALALLLLWPASCTKRPSGAVTFTDRAQEAGITFRHTDGSSGRYFITETLSGGAGLFDYDGDGDLDLYFVNGRPLPPGAPPAGWAKDCTAGNALYRNDGAAASRLPRFTDVTARAGVAGTGFGVCCAAGDHDGDGDLDLFVGQLGPDVLYRNNGDGTFTDVAAAAGVADPAYAGGAAFGDFNRDGHLDLYVANYCIEEFNREPAITNNTPHYWAPSSYPGLPHSLFQNLGNGTFRDVSETSGIRKVKPSQGLGVRFADFDDDGWPDIFVANDGDENFLFHNLKDGTFKNVGLEAGVALDMNGDEQGSMGVDVADYDGDALFDIVVTNYQKQYNAIYRNQGKLLFKDVSFLAGIAANSYPLVGWGTKWFDYDHDGVLDLFIANGHLEDRIQEYDQSSTFLQQNQLFRGLGDGTFREVSNESGPGLLLKRSSRGAAFGDLDNDGDVDILVLCSRDRPLLLMNDGGNRRPWVEIELAGDPPNRHAIGARVMLRSGKRRMMQEVSSGGSYASQNDLRLHFGLGDGGIDSVEVRWPQGKVEQVPGVRPGRLNRIREGRGVVADGPARPER